MCLTGLIIISKSSWMRNDWRRRLLATFEEEAKASSPPDFLLLHVSLLLKKDTHTHTHTHTKRGKKHSDPIFYKNIQQHAQATASQHLESRHSSNSLNSSPSSTTDTHNEQTCVTNCKEGKGPHLTPTSFYSIFHLCFLDFGCACVCVCVFLSHRYTRVCLVYVLFWLLLPSSSPPLLHIHTTLSYTHTPTPTLLGMGHTFSSCFLPFPCLSLDLIFCAVLSINQLIQTSKIKTCTYAHIHIHTHAHMHTCTCLLLIHIHTHTYTPTET
jgi:hypothetical protein